MDTTIYRRYFRVTSGPVVDRHIEIRRQREPMTEEWRKLNVELGATCAMEDPEGFFSGFAFKATPDRGMFKRLGKDKWLPKKNTSKGKDLWARIEPINKMPVIRSCVEVAGLSTQYSLMSSGSRTYFSSVLTVPNSDVVYVSLPWSDVDQVTLEAYRKDRDQDKAFNLSYDHLLWAIPSDWEELDLEEVKAEIKKLRSENEI